jgi:excisionase family DNA binding protein
MQNKPSPNLTSETVGQCLLDTKQVSHYLNLSESFVRKAVARNSIPHRRIGSRVLFRRDDLEKWIDQHLVPMNSEVITHAATLTAQILLNQK